MFPGPVRIPWRRVEHPDELQRYARGLAAPPNLGEEYIPMGGRAHGWVEMRGPDIYQTHYYATTISRHRPVTGGEEPAAEQREEASGVPDRPRQNLEDRIGDLLRDHQGKKK